MGTTLDDLHRIAAHVLGRRRFEVTGHFGLRASPLGVATPAFGPEPEVLRLAGSNLVREVGGDANAVALDGSTLAELAEFAGTDLGASFSAGPGTPPAGPVDQPLSLPTRELDALYEWFDLGARVLDDVLCTHPAVRTGATVQLWPEHFDLATTVCLGNGAQVNLGFSPGDGFSADAYAYVGPWDEARPGDDAFWNAPFGAAAVRAHAPDASSCRAFLGRGLDLLTKG